MRIAICGPVNPFELKEFLNGCQNVPSINKGATAVNTLIREFLRLGHSVLVITATIPGESKDMVLCGDSLIIHIVRSNASIFLSHALSRVYMIPRLITTIKKYRGQFDVLHAQWTYDYAYASSLFASEVPVFCTIRDWCPFILSIQTGLRRIQWKIYEMIFRRVMSCKKMHFIANSEYTYDCVHSDYSDLDVDIIYNPINKDYILKEDRRYSDNSSFISIASSVFEGRKNIDTLLRAFKLFYSKHPQSSLKIVGDYSNENMMKELQKDGLLNGVEFLGLLDHTSLINQIDSCNCLVHPSIEETFGNILIEGMARKVVVIGGANSGAVPIVLAQGKCGILCNVLDVNSLYEAMEKSTDHMLRYSLVNNATEIVCSKYSSEIVALTHIRQYECNIERL